MKTNIGILGVLILAGVGVFMAFNFLSTTDYRSNGAKLVNPESNKSTQTGVVEEASFLEQYPEEYQRLTIPYLREQAFPGSQIQINQTVAQSSSYTSYLATYESEGLKVNGLLTQPQGKMPDGGWPAVVFIHGYIPPENYRTIEKYVAYVDYLARNGLVVFKIDLRGHGNSEGDPNGAYYSSDYIYDALNAYASLQKLDYVNEEKVGLWGHSMAGNVVMRAMAVNPEIPVGVIWAGAVYTYLDMAKYRIQDSSYQPSQNPNRNRRQDLYDSVGEVSEDNQFWQAVAPVNYLADLRGNVEIHHSVNDSVVNIGYSRDLSEALKNAGVQHNYYEYQSGGHNIESPAFNTAIQRTVSAFQAM